MRRHVNLSLSKNSVEQLAIFTLTTLFIIYKKSETKLKNCGIEDFGSFFIFCYFFDNFIKNTATYPF